MRLGTKWGSARYVVGTNGVSTSGVSTNEVSTSGVSTNGVGHKWGMGTSGVWAQVRYGHIVG